MKSAVLATLLVCLCSLSSWAGTFSINLNNESTQIGYIQKLNTQTYGDTLAKARFLYNDHTNTTLGGISAGVTGAPGNVDGLKFGLDVALNGGQTKNDQKLMAVGLGFLADYAPPALRGFGVGGHLLYSPEIFTFLDGKEYFEWGFGASYQVLPNASVTLDYQNVRADIKDYGHRDLDDTVRLGIRLDF